jgi:hypothetical protein
VTVDGTLLRTDRCHVPGPTARTDRSGRRVDLWWSGKHAAHGGNVQVIAAPDCPAPGLMEALIRRKDESHGGTEEVPRRAA